MLDIKFVKNNKEKVKDNIIKKFQNDKLELVDKVVDCYDEYCEVKKNSDEIRAKINKISGDIAKIVKTDEKMANQLKEEVVFRKKELEDLHNKEKILLKKTKPLIIYI